MNTEDIRGCRVTVMGLGQFGGGAAAARWLARQGAVVTATDLAEAGNLSAALQTLADFPIARYRLGGHAEEDFLAADLVVVNPAVRPGNRFVEIARQAGARLTTEIELLLEACPARMIGVTGSNGKSTTAAMVAAICQAHGFRTWLGGNLGGSLLDQLDAMSPPDRVVLEISSFQLSRLGRPARMPQVAVVTNLSPNHLDWHADITEYAAAKQRLLAEQSPDDAAVLNTFDPLVAGWSKLGPGRVVPLVPLDELPPLCVPGRHNRINAACAAAAALAVGCDWQAVERGLAEFRGLPQRLEFVAEVAGRRFYNDSSATTPESVMAALESFDDPVWLLAGGRDKGFDFSPLLTAIAARARGVAFFGAVAAKLHAGLLALSGAPCCTSVETLDAALAWCRQQSRPGDAIVLSPGCSSHDQFRNYRERGECFSAIVKEITAPRRRDEENDQEPMTYD